MNSKTRLAWPTQQTVADELGISERTVRSGLKALEVRRHLDCEGKFRGGRKSNRYRMNLWPVEPEEAANDNRPLGLCQEEETVPAPFERQQVSSHPGKDDPATPDEIIRGTNERTIEKNEGAKLEDSRAQNSRETTNSAEHNTEVRERVSTEKANEIARAAGFGR